MSKFTKIMSVSIITNVSLALIKIIAGILGSSGALIADGVHSISDLATDFIAIIGGFLSKKPADEKHPFGHGKIEYITSLIISLVVMFLGMNVIISVVNKEIVIPSPLVLIISVIAIIAKMLLAKYLVNKGKKYSNNILLASGKEAKADVISSIGVLLAIVCMQFSGSISILKYADILATIIVGIIVIKTGINILKDNISILLEEQIEDEEYTQKIKNQILKEEKVVDITDFYILKYGYYHKLICTVILDKKISLSNAHDIINNIEIRIKKNSKIKYVIIHMEPNIDK